MSRCPNGRFVFTYFLPLCASSPCVSEGGQRFCSNSYSDHSRRAFFRCDCDNWTQNKANMISWLESESEHFFKLVESSMMYHCQSDCELLKIIIKKDSNYLSMLTSEDVVDFKMLPVFEKGTFVLSLSSRLWHFDLFLYEFPTRKILFPCLSFFSSSSSIIIYHIIIS